MEEKPLVSIVMPAYNSEKTIAASILSVKNQTYQNWELIVIDDASVDGTCSIIDLFAKKDNRIRFIRFDTNQGAAAIRNHGIKLCSGKYVAFIDSDDTWMTQKLEKQLCYIEDFGADLCYTSYALTNIAGEIVRPDYIVPSKATFNLLLKENVIGCSTVLVSAEVIKNHHFKSDFYHEDYVLWLELLKNGCTAVGCRDVLTNWCLHENSRSYNKFNSLKSRWRIYRDYLELNLIKSIYNLICYSFAGVHKYGRKLK